MTAFLTRMPAGIPGQVTRLEHSTIEAQAYDPAAPFSAYGLPAKVSASGKMQPMGAGDAATALYGLLVRPYPTTGSPGTGFSGGVGVAVPPTSGVCNILRRGYMMVVLGGAAAAAKAGQVYMRVANAAAGKPIGGYEAAADGANTITLAGAVFTGPADAQGNTEIAYNI